jgi:hypothetical protein
MLAFLVSRLRSNGAASPSCPGALPRHSVDPPTQPRCVASHGDPRVHVAWPPAGSGYGSGRRVATRRRSGPSGTRPGAQAISAGTSIPAVITARARACAAISPQVEPRATRMTSGRIDPSRSMTSPFHMTAIVSRSRARFQNSVWLPSPSPTWPNMTWSSSESFASPRPQACLGPSSPGQLAHVSTPPALADRAARTHLAVNVVERSKLRP